jgi:putative ABC transport system permease protein
MRDMQSVLPNFRYALRQLRRHPGFGITAVLTLAVGIGANASIFSLVDQVLLRRLPVSEPDRLVQLRYTGSDTGHSSSYGGDDFNYFSYPMYRDLRDQNSVFAGMLAMFPAQVGVQWHNASHLANSELVSGNYFSLLGVHPALGRLFVPEDTTTPGAAPFIVLGCRYWTQHFASDPSVINQGILINGNPFTIIGVSQPGFDSVIAGTVPDFFVPITMKAQMTPQWDELTDRRSKWLNIIARLKPGVTVQQAEAGINPLWKSLRAMELQSITTKSQRFREQFVEKSSLILVDGSRGFSPLRGTMRMPLLILIGMVVLLTLMAIANVGSLLLVKAAGRTREISVRYSLGASRTRIIGQLLVEGLVLGLTGGILGLAFSPLLSSALISVIDSTGSTSGTTSLTSAMDARVVIFCFTVSVLASLLFSLAPVLQFYKPQVATALKQQSGTSELGHARFRQITVGVQIGLSLLLLVGAGLFSRTLSNLKSVDVGFVTNRLLTFQLDPQLAGYQPAAITPLYKRLLGALSSQPGVQSVGMTSDPVLANSNDTNSIEVPGYRAEEGERMSFECEHVTPDYFTTLQLPLDAGRFFTEADGPNSAKVAIVNESFVRKFFGDPFRAIGRTFSLGKSNGALVIVGVVRDARHTSVHAPVAPIFYLPLFQDAEPGAVAVYVRTRTAPGPAGGSIRAAVAAMDSKLVVDSLQSLNAEIDTTLTSERMLSFLATSFGTVAIFLAAIGLYGVLAFSIAQRTREIGVRMALGSSRVAILKLVLREVLLITGTAMGAAIPLSIALAHLIKSQLFGVSYLDLRTFSWVILAVAGTTLIAALVPARRAVTVQPISALRYE